MLARNRKFADSPLEGGGFELPVSGLGRPFLYRPVVTAPFRRARGTRQAPSGNLPTRPRRNLHRACDRIPVGDAAAQRDGHAGDERAVALDGRPPAGGRALCRPLGEEATLLALAAQLETAQPWFDRVPAL